MHKVNNDKKYVIRDNITDEYLIKYSFDDEGLFNDGWDAVEVENFDRTTYYLYSNVCVFNSKEEAEHIKVELERLFLINGEDELDFEVRAVKPATVYRVVS